jgi:hypothetical protein
MCQRTHQVFAHHVVGNREDGNRRRRLLRGANAGTGEGENDIDRGLDELCRMLRKLFGWQLEVARIEGQVLTLDEAEPTKLTEESDKVRRIVRTGRQDAEAIGSPRRLSAQLERPTQGGPAEQGDEMAPVHHAITL